VSQPFVNKKNLNKKTNFKNEKINLRKTNANFVEIMDTTLRDGEQTEGVSFSINEKLSIAKKLLQDVKVDRIEIASAKVSEGEKESCCAIFSWAKENQLLDRVEVLGFVDINKSVDWINEAGGCVINLLCKGSEKHCRRQLNKTPKQHFNDIKKTIEYAHSKNFVVNAYLEDFSNGIKSSKKYVYDLVKVLNKNKVKRILLADTLGIFSPVDVEKYVSLLVKKFAGQQFDFHAHNDYGLATANSLASINAGCLGLHVTVNGLGERTGNAALEQIVPGVADFTLLKTRVNEKKLAQVSRLVELFSKRRVAKNSPIIGGVVFTQTAGIHADGDKKGELYKSKLSAKRFGRKTTYALGKLSGKASVSMALKQLGIILGEDEVKQVLAKVVALGEKKEFVSKEDLLFLVDTVKNNGVQKSFKIKKYELFSSSKRKPNAKISVLIDGKKYKANAFGDGGYDAFVTALKKIFKMKKMHFPELNDYEVRIPVGGKTDALVETKITWKSGNKKFETVGVSTDQIEAAIKATEKMVNIIMKLN